MSRRRPGGDELGELRVEEIDVGAWGRDDDWRTTTQRPSGPPMSGPPSGPPAAAGPPIGVASGGPTATPPTRPAPPDAVTAPGAPWWRRSANQLVAVAGAIVLLVVVIGLAAGGGDAPGAAPTTPSTTAPAPTRPPRPVQSSAPSTATPSGSTPSGSTNGATPTVTDASDDEDFRFALADPEEGYEVVSAHLVEGDQDGAWFRPPSPVLFAGEGSTWSAGPWLMVTGSSPQFGPYRMFSFRRPPARYQIGDVEARTGEAEGGVELTVLRQGATVVEVAGLGLDPLATIAVAEQIQVAGSGIAIPDAAVPAGLHSRPATSMADWSWGQLSRPRAGMSFRASGGGYLDISVGVAAAADAWSDEAAFFLGDLRYVSIRGDVGVAGMVARPGGEPAALVRWRRGDRDYLATGWAMSVDEVVRVAASIVQPGDQAWHADRWDDALQQAERCCDDDGTYVEPDWVEVPLALGGDDDWTGQVALVGDVVEWNLFGERTGLGVSTPAITPRIQVAATSDWDTQDFTAGAVALADRSMTGAALRLTTTGSTPQTIEIPLQPVDDQRLPFLAAAAVVPWPDGGFVAQLIGPDGRTIVLQSDRELP